VGLIYSRRRLVTSPSLASGACDVAPVWVGVARSRVVREVAHIIHAAANRLGQPGAVITCASMEGRRVAASENRTATRVSFGSVVGLPPRHEYYYT